MHGGRKRAKCNEIETGLSGQIFAFYGLVGTRLRDTDEQLIIDGYSWIVYNRTGGGRRRKGGSTLIRDQDGQRSAERVWTRGNIEGTKTLIGVVYP